jgi:hypothetical protein
MAREKKYKISLTFSELELLYLEFESCLGVGGEDPGFTTIRDKALAMLREINGVQEGSESNGRYLDQSETAERCLR